MLNDVFEKSKGKGTAEMQVKRYWRYKLSPTFSDCCEGSTFLLLNPYFFQGNCLFSDATGENNASLASVIARKRNKDGLDEW